MEQIICGIDVAKAKLDASILPGNINTSFANTAQGITQLAAFCQDHQVALVVMEATGGLERLAFLMLWELGQPAALANPRQVRRFAEALGFLEKTDRIDAAIIARFAQAKAMTPDAPPSPAQRRLRALVQRLTQLTGDLTVNRQRRAASQDAEAQASIDTVLAVLRSEARRLEGEIASLIDDDPLWSALKAAWADLKGVAGRTIARLMAELPEIGTLDNKAIAKLSGLAPLAHDSGKHKGKRPVRGGRAGVRAILFLVARIASQYHPGLKAFAQRLVSAGKPKMVTRIALARKLLVILNAKARDARAQLAHAT